MTNFRQGGLNSIPSIVKNIIIINVLVVVIQFALGKQGINLGDYLGLHYWQSPNFRWYQLFTHMFVHGDPYDVSATISHIFFNMFALWMLGSVLESVWGPKRFLIFYLVCGVGAAFCHLGVLTFEFSRFHNAFLQYQQHPGFVEFMQFVRHNDLTGTFQPEFIKGWEVSGDSPMYINESIKGINEIYMAMINTNTVGASGAVFGILFAFGYLFPNTPLYLMFIPVPIKAKWFVAGYAAIELFSGIGRFAGDNVAHFAHLGGMLFAFILLRIWRKNNRNDFY